MTGQVAVVVQARMGSSRFPGKVLAPFADSTLLQHVLRRLRRSERRPELWVATTRLPEDDAVAVACREEGVRVTRGAATDVLGRYVACLNEMPATPDLVVRVCADRPFVCPRLLDEMLEFYELTGGADYLANNLPPSFPDGLDLELVRAASLLAAHAASDDPYEREHVTPFVYRRPEEFRLVNYPCPYGSFGSTRAVIDMQEDYEVLRRVERSLAELDPEYEYRDVLNLASVEPGVFPSPTR